MTAKKATSIHWFRKDLRLSDNPGFSAACSNGSVLPIYILDKTTPEESSLGAASRWWLYHSLTKLNQALDGKLHIFSGNPKEIIEALTKQYPVEAVFWNRCYEAWSIQRDSEIKKWLTDNEIVAKSFNGSLLWEPWDITKSDGTPYKVFTPYYRRGCLSKSPPREPIPVPVDIEFARTDANTLCVDDLDLLPKIRWDEKFESQWNIGEQAARRALEAFIKSGASNYQDGRNFPSEKATSKLSPHLSFGELSPNQIWQATSTLPLNDDVDCFRSELGWREFSYYLLYHFPKLPTKNFQPKFDEFEWQANAEHLDAWTSGNTGIPIVDAGMRELWQTGYMHNRVRMIVASYLVKNLLQHWHEGAQWFWDCLVDADLASNSASWQWVAGCGADAAPYFRIFNPVTQGEKFDKSGEYTRRFVPELKKLPDKYLFRPWEAPEEVLQDAGIILGTSYPAPIADLKASRERALSAFKALKKSDQK